MSKGLEALKRVHELIVFECGSYYENNYEEIKIIEKELKVLEIIKKYILYNDSWYLNQAQYGNEEIYLRMENVTYLNDEEKEEFNKVKEWLKNEN